MRPRYELNGKVALITGGAQGIGLGIAQALHARGAKLALVDIDAKAAANAAQGFDGALGLAADVTNRGAITAAVDATVERFGGLDVVVANAGIAAKPATIRVRDPDEFERVVEVDLLGVYRTVHAALPQVIERRGQAVLVSSIYAFTNGVLAAPYAVAKAGVEQLGRAMRAELVRHGASASVAYFGFVDTEMVHSTIDQSPIGARVMELVPPPLRARITPAVAGEAVAVGIERRRPRIITPRQWVPLSVLRGIVGPLSDIGAERYPKAQALVAEADIEERVTD